MHPNIFNWHISESASMLHVRTPYVVPQNKFVLILLVLLLSEYGEAKLSEILGEHLTAIGRFQKLGKI